jgi:hypothetical protein
LYKLLFHFLTALMKTGVAVCGGSVVQALAGRTRKPRAAGPVPNKPSIAGQY